MSGPASAPQGGTAVRPRARTRLKPPAPWSVWLHNDDYTTQAFVVAVLMQVFRKPEAEAVQLMLDVHRRGKGLAGVYPHDVAETKVLQVKALAEAQGFPLLCTMQPEAS